MYSFEEKYFSLGYKFICGTDEVGRGPLAGPLVCAAVILDPNNPIEGLNDSKKLSERKRIALDIEIREKALAFNIVYIDIDTIDKINIYQASKKGMLDAIKELSISPDFVLSDAMPLGDIPHESIIKGDSKSASIAAASILAKVERDKHMVELSKKYPEYDLANNKGYPTKKHLDALKQFSYTDIHRKTYKPIKDLITQQMTLDI